MLPILFDSPAEFPHYLSAYRTNPFLALVNEGEPLPAWGIAREEFHSLFSTNEVDITELLGDSEIDRKYWHPQTYPDTSAIVAQQCILESVTGKEYSETELRLESMLHDWYRQGAGTPLDAIGAVLRFHGIPCEKCYGARIEAIAEALRQGEKVIVAVALQEIGHEGVAPLKDRLGSLPDQWANYPAVVLGMLTPPQTFSKIILQTPIFWEDSPLILSLDHFLEAWESSNHFLLRTRSDGVALSSPVVLSLGALSYRPRLVGYYNADGTYHCNYDKTDRHPITGTVIRYV